MTFVFELPPFDLPRPCRFGRCRSLQGLHPGLLVGADNVRALGLKSWGIQIRSAHRAHLVLELLWIGWLGIEPVARHVRP